MKNVRAPLLAWALACPLAVFTWQALTVHYNYSGNWSGLFLTGANFTVPPSLKTERIWQFPDSNGWDGQFYHYIAHDPSMRNRMSNYIDAPRLRYRRILIPGLAFLLAAGRQENVDWAYRVAVLLFFVLGTYWTGRLAIEFGRSPAWSLAFFFVPAAIYSTDRLAIDVALAAFVPAFALYSRKPRNQDDWKLFAVLLFAALARETGLLLTGGYCIWLLTKRRFAQALFFSAAAFPALAWYSYVATRTPAFSAHDAFAAPLTGLIGRIVHPQTYPFSGGANLLIHSLDFLSVLGALLALILVLRRLGLRLKQPTGYAMLLFCLIDLALPGDWPALDYGRVLSPLYLLLMSEGLETRSLIYLAPWCMALPRAGAGMGSQVYGVLKGIAGIH